MNVLEYARPAKHGERDPEASLRSAQTFAVLPLIAGVVIFLLWLVTRWPYWAVLGLANIVLGTLLVLIGLLCVLSYVLEEAGIPRYGTRHMLLNAAGTTALLFSNFPAAYVIIRLVAWIGFP